MASAIPVPALSEDEKTMALLAHILQIFTSWIGPLIIYFVKRESKFVAFHAMQALLLQIVLVVLTILCVMLWIFLLVVIVLTHTGTAPGNATPPFELIAVIPLLWFGMMAVGLANIVLGIVYAVRASRGERASYPVVGGWARRIVGV